KAAATPETRSSAAACGSARGGRRRRRWSSGSRGPGPGPSPGGRFAPSSPTSWPTVESGRPISPSPPSRTRRARRSSWPSPRQAGQLARLVDDLLDLSRVTRGRIVLRLQTAELGPIVEQAVEAVRARYGSLRHELTVTLPSQPVQLTADPARLAQIVGNLLNN